MHVITAKRVFSYQGMELPDLASMQPPEAVKALYAMQYPELTNSEVHGPEVRGTNLVYTFVRATGTKGDGSLDGVPAVPFVERLAAIAAGQDDPMRPLLPQFTLPVPFDRKPVERLAQALSLNSRDVQAPSSALPAMV